ncbi:beta-2 adrenergic receptor-like [Limulus polyphemus]|uniref:Beta-2 adrenergic receptor-like n=1 Tax=Limulus polyphemus TaxID=6850 RepID=A0ABM1B926_LIMPO|nr:beta-2 adrenergic receptor-like [Limulus polyphemus]
MNNRSELLVINQLCPVSAADLDSPGSTEILKCLWITLVTVAIVVLNLLMISVLHSRNHTRYLRQQPRMFMTSLACTDLAVGLFVTPLSVYPALYRCWPFGGFVCAVEALLISALFHESTLSLVCIAIDRYICIVLPLRYNSVMTKKVCITMIAVSWILSTSVYCMMIYPSGEFKFDSQGILVCEPNYTNTNIIILATVLFYFPPLVVILYCYYTIFSVAQKQLRSVQAAPCSVYNELNRCSTVQRFQAKEKLKQYRTAVTLGAIALGFLLAVTPWTLTTLVSSCLEKQLSSTVEFTVTWVAVSNSFWNPIIYGMLNKSFRSIAVKIIRRTFCCKEVNSHVLNYISAK